MNGVAVASETDAQYGLHRAPPSGEIPIVWLRGGKTWKGALTLSDGWRKTDISWRRSLQDLEPSPWVYGENLTALEKKNLGLSERQLAFYMGSFVPTPARQAGIQA